MNHKNTGIIKYGHINCPCRRTQCKRHGDCEACRAYHRSGGSKYAAACERLLNNKKKKL